MALEHLPKDKTFNLIGYSYGSAMTLELAALLEKEGRVGKVVLIDGTPFMIQKVVQQKILSETEDQFQNNVLSVVVNVCLPNHDNTEIIVSSTTVPQLPKHFYPNNVIFNCRKHIRNVPHGKKS